jgi:hypothetical protein
MRIRVRLSIVFELTDIVFYRKNFVDGWEPDGSGATFAVYHKDRLVVDLYGGCANGDDGRSWQSDTLSTMFSTTKVCPIILR